MWYLILLGLLYFLPSIIALFRNHNELRDIVSANVSFGWTIVAWFHCLKWSLED